jgi:hypothetical protein
MEVGTLPSLYDRMPPESGRIILPIANMIFSNIPRETKRMDWRVGC